MPVSEDLTTDPNENRNDELHSGPLSSASFDDLMDIPETTNDILADQEVKQKQADPT